MKEHWVGLVRDFVVGSTCAQEGQKWHAQNARGASVLSPGLAHVSVRAGGRDHIAPPLN